ncbi:MAG: hypothetical protein OXF20_01155 [Gammaproteobacteria bacterium]|nr:hypothetical protein [Gammaproteobacteria bacterium]
MKTPGFVKPVPDRQECSGILSVQFRNTPFLGGVAVATGVLRIARGRKLKEDYEGTKLKRCSEDAAVYKLMTVEAIKVSNGIL